LVLVGHERKVDWKARAKFCKTDCGSGMNMAAAVLRADLGAAMVGRGAHHHHRRACSLSSVSALPQKQRPSSAQRRGRRWKTKSFDCSVLSLHGTNKNSLCLQKGSLGARALSSGAIESIASTEDHIDEFALDPALEATLKAMIDVSTFPASDSEGTGKSKRHRRTRSIFMRADMNICEEDQRRAYDDDDEDEEIMFSSNAHQQSIDDDYMSMLFREDDKDATSRYMRRRGMLPSIAEM